MNTKKAFSERLRKAMLAAGHEARPAILEREFNDRYWGRSIAFQTASGWLRGVSIPTQDKLVVLAEWLKVEPHVLRYGDKAARGVRVQEKKQLWPESVGAVDRATVEAFLALPAVQRKVVRDVIMTVANTPKPRTQG
jgi:hypothetical protein